MTSKNALRGAVFIVISLAILLRWCVSLHPYSGQGIPPMFGDYEAQRHWMEITYNLPLKDWYANTSHNDLMYWGLDYPPITAYHSFICGYVAKHLNPAFIALNSSRGHESYEHKLFMRATVLVADLIVYIPAVWWYFSCKKSTASQRSIATSFDSGDGGRGGGDGGGKDSKGDSQRKADSNSSPSQILALYLALVYPGLILVDYGHFQYNNVSLGLTIAAIAALCRKFELTASVLFCFAVNYKQMELYHAIPFFCYLLGLCLPRKNQPFIKGFVRLLKIGFVVIFSFSMVWLPFLHSTDLSSQVIHRLFPLARGVFEDKVANVWCSLNVLYKLRNAFSVWTMAKICVCTTLLAVIPSSIDLLLHPNIRKFLISLINSSLAFFLFSFQVHEKSILLAAIPVTLYLPVEPLTGFWFLYISTFSMLPLILKDGLLLAYVALTIFHALSMYLTTDFQFKEVEYNTSNIGSLVFKCTPENSKKTAKLQSGGSTAPSQMKNFLRLAFVLSILGCVILTLCISTLQPPARYPDLYPLLISVYSAGHFVLFFFYFNYRQFLTVPPKEC